MKRLGACLMMALSSGAIAAPPKRIDVALECGADGAPKSLTLSGKKIELRGSDPYDQIKAAFGKDRPEVRLFANADTPYRCIGGIIFAMQRLGISKISMITDPALKDTAAR